MAESHGSLSHLLASNYRSIVSAWLEEDCPTFDYGGFVVGEGPAQAMLFSKSAGILAGVPFFDEVFRQLGCTYDDSICRCPLVLGIQTPAIRLILIG